MSVFNKGNPNPPGSGRLLPVGLSRDAADRFGSRAQTVQIITFNLAAAQSQVEKRMTGNVIWAIDGTDNNAALTVRFNEQSGEGITFKKGMFVKGIAFDRLYITNAAQAAKTLTLLVAVEGDQLMAIENAAEALSSITITGTVETLEKKPSFFSTPDISLLAGVTTQIVSVATDRLELIISNLAANTQTFRLGDSSTSSGEGLELSPGQTLVIGGTSALHGFNPGASAESVGIVVVQN